VCVCVCAYAYACVSLGASCTRLGASCTSLGASCTNPHQVDSPRYCLDLPHILRLDPRINMQSNVEYGIGNIVHCICFCVGSCLGHVSEKLVYFTILIYCQAF
jgi:hypothetical protein